MKAVILARVSTKRQKEEWTVTTKGDSFFINEEEKYKYNPNDLSNWKVLEL